jgi:amino acid permease
MNGGILFSVTVLSFIALISLYSFLLLVKAKFVVSGSFGDIGGALYGPWMRYAILTSIVVSQMGFVCAYIIFVSENLQVCMCRTCAWGTRAHTGHRRSSPRSQIARRSCRSST